MRIRPTAAWALVTATALTAPLLAAGPAAAAHQGGLHLAKIQYDSPGKDTRSNASLNAGWLNLTNTRGTLKIDGHTIGLTGLDDPHIKRDRYARVAGGPAASDDFSLAVVHAPYLRTLDAFTSDGYPLILAGHTHGGQLCIPFYGALVTNCDLDTDRVKGLSTHTEDGRTAYLHVSAGCGTNRYTPVRFACPPEATLLTLTERETHT